MLRRPDNAVKVRTGKDMCQASALVENELQSKKTFAVVDYEMCSPEKCNPEGGVCAAASACTRKVIKQIDGVFEPPVIFQDMCMACWECIEACPLDAIQVRHVS